MGHNVRSGKLVARFGHNARHIQRDIAIADHHGIMAGKVGVEVGIDRMAIIPADKGGAAINIGEVGAGNIQRLVQRRAGGQHHRVIQAHQFGHGDIAADGHIAQKPHIVRQGHRLIAARHALDRLVIGRHARADQAIGHRQPVENIDAHIVAPLLLRGFGGVIAGGPGSDNGDMQHVTLSHPCQLADTGPVRISKACKTLHWRRFGKRKRAAPVKATNMRWGNNTQMEKARSAGVPAPAVQPVRAQPPG